MGSEIQGIEVQGRVIKGSKVEGVYGTTLGYDTGYGILMEYIYWKNILRGYVESSWALQVTVGAYLIAHVRMYMACMIWSSGVREGCMR